MEAEEVSPQIRKSILNRITNLLLTFFKQGKQMVARPNRQIIIQTIKVELTISRKQIFPLNFRYPQRLEAPQQQGALLAVLASNQVVQSALKNKVLCSPQSKVTKLRRRVLFLKIQGRVTLHRSLRTKKEDDYQPKMI